MEFVVKSYKQPKDFMEYYKLIQLRRAWLISKTLQKKSPQGWLAGMGNS